MVTIGQVAFEAYCASVGGKTYDSKPIPQWHDLTSVIQDAWESAALTAANASRGQSTVSQLTEREIKEIKHALLYSHECNHGTTGHNQLVLIAKLADILGFRLEYSPAKEDCPAQIEVVLPSRARLPGES